jgi:dTDP-4-amino-4,6-dideoxygalactose transaminase
LYWSLHQYETTNPRLLSLYPQLYDIYGDITVYRLEDDEWSDMPGWLRGLADNAAQRARMTALYDEMLIEPPRRQDKASEPQRRGERRDQRESSHFHTLTRQEGSVLWKYPLIVPPDLRDDLLGHLWEQGIQDATRWYPPLRHMMSALLPDAGQPPTPGTDALGDSIINLPLGAGADEAYVRRAAGLVWAFYQAGL